MAKFYICDAPSMSKLRKLIIMPYSDVVRGKNLYYSKNGHVWVAQWSFYRQFKIKFDLSLERSWCEILL